MRQAVLRRKIGYLTFSLQAFRASFLAAALDSKPATIPHPCAFPTDRVIAIAFQPSNLFHVLKSRKHDLLSDLIPKLADAAGELELDPIKSAAKTTAIAMHLDAGFCGSVENFMRVYPSIVFGCSSTGTRLPAAVALRFAWRAARWVHCK